MTNSALPPKEQAVQHLQAALATGVRGTLRDGIKALLAQSTALSGTPRADLEYRNLAQGAKLRCPAHPGLLMRNGKRSGKVWIFAYRDKDTGKEREHQFGRYPNMSTADAREAWSDLRDRHKAGEPLTEQPLIVTTLSDLLDAYLIAAQGTKRSLATDERLIRKHILPEHGNTNAENFTDANAAQIILTLYQTRPREAEKVKAALSCLYAFGTGRAKNIAVPTPLLPKTLPNPAQAVSLPKRNKKTDLRKHTPEPSELTAYVEALDAALYGKALRLQLLTITRIQETTGATWSEIDLEHGQWTIPAARMKAKEGHTILLSPQALDLLRTIKSDQVANNVQTEFVFPAPRSNGDKLIRPEAAQRDVQRLRNQLNLHPDFTSHSLRIAGITWLGENLCPDPVQRRMTAHSQGSDAHAGYQNAKYNQPAKDWWNRWADHLDALVQPNVVLLARGA